jgi:hypothetical protein
VSWSNLGCGGKLVFVPHCVRQASAGKWSRRCGAGSHHFGLAFRLHGQFIGSIYTPVSGLAKRPTRVGLARLNGGTGRCLAPREAGRRIIDRLDRNLTTSSAWPSRSYYAVPQQHSRMAHGTHRPLPGRKERIGGGGSESLAEGALCDPAGAPERADPDRN